MDKDQGEYFIHKLSKELIKNNFNIVSGFGLGVGSCVISGALEELYMNQGTIDDERLILRPFPQGEKGKAQWEKYRKDMIARTGISIFIYGNKEEDGKLVSAGGVQSEFNISRQQTNHLVPVGATGYVAKELWDEVNKNFDRYYPNADNKLKEMFKELNDEKLTIDELIVKILDFVKLISN